MKIKKVLSLIALSAVMVLNVFAAPSNSSKKVLSGKDGLFAVIETEKGEMVLELFYKDTPLTVINFVGLAEGTLDAAKGKPFYDGLKFHRVISDFMIQGGDPKGNGTGGPGYKFPDEWSDKYSFDGPGYLAMANSGPDTNGSQFFITHVPTDWLNGKHTIFGKIIEGQNVVNAVAQNDTIIHVTIIRKGEEANKFSATQNDFNRTLNKVEKIVAEKKHKEEEEAKKAYQEFLDELEKGFKEQIKGCKKTKNGIYYTTLQKGNGKKVGKGKNVTVEYQGYFTNGTLFDATKTYHTMGHESLQFVTAAGKVIQGWDEMVQDMEYGEERHIVIPPELGYGPRGIPGAIPGNVWLVFDVTVIK